MCDSMLDQFLFGEEALNGGGGSLVTATVETFRT